MFSASEPQQVETFKYLANAILRELYCSAVTKCALSKNARLSVFKGPVTRGDELENFSLPLEKCVGYSLKILDIVQKICDPLKNLFAPPGVPSWLRAWFLNGFLFRSSPVVMNLRWRLKKYCQQNKRQRWDICEEFSVWHFVTKSTGLKSVKPRMSSHFSESRDPTYVSSAMCPKCAKKEWRTKSFRLQSTPTEKRSKVCQGPGGVTTSPTLLDPVLVWSQQNYLRLLLIVRYFGSS